MQIADRQKAERVEREEQEDQSRRIFLPQPGFQYGWQVQTEPIEVGLPHPAANSRALAHSSFMDTRTSTHELEPLRILNVTIKEQLGAGAFGEVYKAEWNSLPVAAKKLSVESELITETSTLRYSSVCMCKSTYGSFVES